MQVIVKCCVPEGYEFVTHAVIPMDIKLIDTLLNAMELANKAKLENSKFSGSEYSGYNPYFIAISAELADEFDISEDDFDTFCDDGYHILPGKMDNHNWNTEGMRCTLVVNAGYLKADRDSSPVGEIIENSSWIYWYAYDKYDTGTSGRVETGSLSHEDLKEIREQLSVTV